MKILLLFPPYTKDKIFRKQFKHLGAVLPPLGIAYLAAVLEKAGHDVKIIDGPAQANVYDYSYEEMQKEIIEFKPDIVGVSAQLSQYELAKKSLRLVKEINTKIITFLGGKLISAEPNRLNEFNDADYGITGEAEFAFRDIVQKIANKEPIEESKGLVYRDKDEIKSIKPDSIMNLDDLPFPAWHLLKMELYKPSPANYRRLPATTMMTSRGCPYYCIFCAMGRTEFRAHSAKRVVDEIEYLIKNYGIKDIEVFDDTFTLDMQRTIDICNGIIERGLDIGWNCITRVDRVNPEVFQLMKKAGCYEVGFGIESGVQRVLNLIKKGITTERVRKAVKWAKDAGIDVRGFLTIGYPTETKEEILQTIGFAKELNLDVAQFMIATPLPGTELWEMAKQMGKVDDSDYMNFTFFAPEKIPFSSENFTDKELLELYKKAYRSFYLRPHYIMRQILKIRNRDDLKRNWLAAKGVLGFQMA